MTPDALLDPLGVERFLTQYWQQQPLHLPQAWPEPPVMLEADELAGLATAPDMASQIVMGDTAAEDWMLIDGPVTETFFSDTPDTDWHLTVQAVDRHVPACYRLREPFRFLADWRFDAVAGCYAAPGGTRGPDSDDADVFILQVSGEQDWTLQWPGNDAPDDTEQVSTQTLQIRTQPGDLIYIPPGVDRYGTALTDSLSYCIRFRAPTLSELFLAWAHDHARQLDDGAPIVATDGDQGAPGDLRPALLDTLRERLQAAISSSETSIEAWLPAYLTTPTEAIEPVSSTTPETPEAIEAALTHGRELVVNPASRLAVSRRDPDHPRLFVDGREQPEGVHAPGFMERLSAARRITAKDLAGLASDSRRAGVRLLLTGFRSGWLVFDDELGG
jgi:50S ribosomal protein L16 3-hydroxylase